jgi:hypothetical protein
MDLASDLFSLPAFRLSAIPARLSSMLVTTAKYMIHPIDTPRVELQDYIVVIVEGEWRYCSKGFWLAKGGKYNGKLLGNEKG